MIQVVLAIALLNLCICVEGDGEDSGSWAAQAFCLPTGWEEHDFLKLY